MKTIKVIDLLNLIVEEEQPSHIRIYNRDWYWNNYDGYVTEGSLSTTPDAQIYLFGSYRLDFALDKEVEIIEEEKDSFSGIRYFQDGNCYMSISSEPPKTQDIVIEKEIEKIKIHQEYTSKGKLHDYLYYQDNKYALSLPQKVLTDTLNELIDAVNELKRDK